MHIVFLVGNYYPYYSAVSKCVGNVADILAQNHKVTIVCEKTKSNQLDTEQYNNQTIHRIITHETIRRESISNCIHKERGIKKIFYKSKGKMLKFRLASKLVFSNESIKQSLIKAYISKLLEINTKIDVIIPASLPFESVVAADQYKKKYNSNVTIIPYLFDKFTESSTLHRLNINRIIKRKAHIKLEINSLLSSKNIIAMHSLKRFYESNFPELTKIRYMEHPLLVRDKNLLTFNEPGISIAYIGGFYKNYVEPNYFLNLFYHSKANAKLELYVLGNCERIINKYSQMDSERIFNCGSVDKATASRKIKESHILISVAEKKGLQMSSKIFDYISYGKPIIHFYKSDNDINLKVLKKYPLALCIKEDEQLLTKNVHEFEAFCVENLGKTVPWDKVVELFPDALPEYTSSIIETIMEGKHE